MEGFSIDGAIQSSAEVRGARWVDTMWNGLEEGSRFFHLLSLLPLKNSVLSRMDIAALRLEVFLFHEDWIEARDAAGQWARQEGKPGGPLLSVLMKTIYGDEVQDLLEIVERWGCFEVARDYKETLQTDRLLRRGVIRRVEGHSWVSFVPGPNFPRLPPSWRLRTYGSKQRNG